MNSHLGNVFSMYVHEFKRGTAARLRRKNRKRQKRTIRQLSQEAAHASDKVHCGSTRVEQKKNGSRTICTPHTGRGFWGAAEISKEEYVCLLLWSRHVERNTDASDAPLDNCFQKMK
jgi:hypothetical protein